MFKPMPASLNLVNG